MRRSSDSELHSSSRGLGSYGDRHHRTAGHEAKTQIWFCASPDAIAARSVWPAPPQRVRVSSAVAGGRAYLVLAANLANVKPIAQHVEKWASRECYSPSRPACRQLAHFASEIAFPQLDHCCRRIRISASSFALDLKSEGSTPRISLNRSRIRVEVSPCAYRKPHSAMISVLAGEIPSARIPCSAEIIPWSVVLLICCDVPERTPPGLPPPATFGITINIVTRWLLS